MANISKVKRAPVYLDLDKQRQLKYTLNSFATMEDRYGTIDDAMTAMDKGSMKAVRFMLWVGLTHEDKTLTELEVGDLIELQDLEDLTNKMALVMELDSPDKSAEAITTLPNA